MTRRGLRHALIASSLVRSLRTSVTFLSDSPVAVRGVGERGP